MCKIKKGMKVLIKNNIPILEEWLVDYKGLIGFVQKVDDTNYSYPITVKFKKSYLKEKSLNFHIRELKIIKNKIKKL